MAIKIGDAFISIGGDTSRLRKQFKDLHKYVRNIMIGISGAIIGGLTKAVQEAADLQKGLREVASLGVENLDRLRVAAEDVAIAYGVNLDGAIRELYLLISAQVPEDIALEALGLAAMAAKANVGSLHDAMDIGTSLLAAYGVHLRDGDEALGLFGDSLGAMTAAVNIGKTTFSDMGGSIGQVTALLDQAGISLPEFSAALGALTQQGGGASEQVTKLKAMIGNLIKITPESAKHIELLNSKTEGLNIEFGTGAIKAKGFRDFLVDLVEGIKAGIPGLTAEKAALLDRKFVLEGNLEAGQQWGDTLKRQSLELSIAGQTLKKGNSLWKENNDAKNENRRMTLENSIAQREMSEELGEVEKALGDIGPVAINYETSLGKLFESKQAISGILALTTTQLDLFDKGIAKAELGVDNLYEAYDLFRKDNPKEDVLQVVSAIQVLTSRIGSGLLPELGKISRAILPILISAVEWIRANEELTATITKVVAIFGALLAGLLALGAAIKISAVLLAPFVTMLGALVSIPGLIIVAIVALAAVIYKFWDSIRPILEQFWEKIQEVLGPPLNALFEKAKLVWETFRDEAQLVWQTIVQTFERHWEQIKEIFKVSVDIIIQILQMAWTFFEIIFNTLAAILAGFGLGVKESWDQSAASTEAGTSGILDMLQGFLEGFRHFNEMILKIMNGLNEFIEKWFDPIVEFIAEGTKNIFNLLNWFVQFLWGIVKHILSMFEVIWNAFTKFVNFIIEGVKWVLNGIGSIWDAFSGLLGFGGGGVIPAFASGGTTPGGMVLVGEQGPELAALPAKTRVFSNEESQSMLNEAVRGEGKTTNIDKVVLFENAVIRETADMNTLMDKAGHELRRILNQEGGEVTVGGYA
jgi:TP901 family phage tail tape measure protein